MWLLYMIYIRFIILNVKFIIIKHGLLVYIFKCAIFKYIGLLTVKHMNTLINTVKDN